MSGTSVPRIFPTIDDLLARERIAVVAKPGASRTALLGVRGDALHVALAAPPVDGKANAELERFLSKRTGKRCTVVAGATGKRKVVRCV